MFECPHERQAMRSDAYDHRWWEEHPCPCVWNWAVYVGVAITLFPVAVSSVVIEKVRKRFKRS